MKHGYQQWAENYPKKELRSKMSQKFTFGYIIGVLLGDGWLAKNSIRLKTVDADFVDFFATQLRTWSHIEPHQYQYKTAIRTFPNGITSLCKDNHQVVLCSKQARDQIEKYVSNLIWIETANYDVKLGILKGLWDSEGYIHNYKICFCNTESEVLKLYKRLIFEFLGITQFQERIRDNGKVELEFSGPQNLLNFVKIVGITIRRKAVWIEPWLEKLQFRRELYEKALKLESLGQTPFVIDKEFRKKYRITARSWFTHHTSPTLVKARHCGLGGSKWT